MEPKFSFYSSKRLKRKCLPMKEMLIEMYFLLLCRMAIMFKASSLRVLASPRTILTTTQVSSLQVKKDDGNLSMKLETKPKVIQIFFYSVNS